MIFKIFKKYKFKRLTNEQMMLILVVTFI